MAKAQKFEVEFIKKIRLNLNTYEFHFSRPQSFKFIPGQYLKMFVPVKKPDKRGTSRYFTISSSPRASDITITTKIIRSTFKKSLGRFKKGDKVLVFGPIGYFNFDLNNKKSKILLSGGIGITPIHSLLQTIGQKRLESDVVALCSFRKAEDVIYKKEFDEIRKNKKINIIFTLTKEIRDGFEKGRIDRPMIEKYFPFWKKAEFFVTGSEETEKGLLALLEKMGVKKENIFSENFPGY